MSNLKDDTISFNKINKMNDSEINFIDQNLPPIPKPLLIRSLTIVPQCLDDVMSFCYYVKNNPFHKFTKLFKSKQPENPNLLSIYKELIKNPNWLITPTEVQFPHTFWNRYQEGLKLQNN